MAKKKEVEKKEGGVVRDLDLVLTGTRKLVTHNARLANPFDEYAQAVAEISSKRTKTMDDRRQLASYELRGGMYETSAQELGIPLEAIWKSIAEAATAFKLGKQVARALRFSPEVIPIEVPGLGIVGCDEYASTPAALYFTSVGVSKKRIMRARPQVAAGWIVRPTFSLDEGVLDLGNLMKVLDRAGAYIGIGERRPLFGTFNVVVVP